MVAHLKIFLLYSAHSTYTIILPIFSVRFDHSQDVSNQQGRESKAVLDKDDQRMLSGHAVDHTQQGPVQVLHRHCPGAP